MRSSPIPVTYDDPKNNYQKYWLGRDYEHQAEILAIKKLLKDKKFELAVDVGGGYGRLEPTLVKFAERVILAEPSPQQMTLAKNFLASQSKVSLQSMRVEALAFEPGSVNLIIMVRVMHHLPDPTKALGQISRVLAPGGCAVIEVANYMHRKNRLKRILHRKATPKELVSIGSADKSEELPFVNHNPKTFIDQITKSGLEVDRILSVSNFRYLGTKRVVPRRVMLAIEGILQPVLSSTFFGPSIFFLVHKPSN